MDRYDAEELKADAVLLGKWGRIVYLLATITSIGGSVALIGASGVTFDGLGIVVSSLAITASFFVSFGVAIVVASVLNILARFAMRVAEKDEEGGR